MDRPIPTEEASCCICLDSLNGNRGRQTLPCGHVLHEACVTEMRRHGGSGSCPLCRQQSADLTSVNDLLDQGIVLQMRGAFGEGFKMFSDALDLDPENDAVVVQIANALVHGLGVAKDLPRAEMLLEAQMHSGSHDVKAAMAEVYRFQGRKAEAENLLQDLYRGGDLEAACDLAWLFFTQGRMDHAEQLFEEAHAAAVPASALGLGSIRLDQGLFSEAESLFNEACASEKTHWQGIIELARLHEAQDHTSEAERLFEEAWRQGHIPQAARLLGDLNLKRGHTLQAEQLFQEALQAGDEMALDGLAQAYSMQGRAEEAEQLFAQSPNSVPAMPSIGDTVALHGLVSEAGRRLNGCMGFVDSFNADTGRIGVQIASEGLKWFKPENLSFQNKAEDRTTKHESLEPHDPELAVALGPEELEVQAAVEASFLIGSSCSASMHGGSSVNAQISSALLQSSSQGSTQRVLLITFSRHPKLFRSALMKDDRLSECRQSLQEHNFEEELPNGAKVFVKPEQYEPLIEFIRLSKYKFAPWHLFVQPSLEGAVMDIMGEVNAKLSKKEKFYVKHSKTVPLAFAASVKEMDCNARILRTFIDIYVPSSLLSDGGSGPRTMSTTDADARKKQNPRLLHGRR